MQKINLIGIGGLTALLLAFVFTSSSPADTPKIAVFKSRDLCPYNKAFAGFKRRITKERIDVELTLYDMHGSEQEAMRICKEINSKNPAIVLTLGSEATRIAQEKVSDIPIVFTVVLDPLASGFVKDLEKPGGNLTGVAMEIPPNIQFKTLKNIMPEVKKIGFIFDPDNTGLLAKSAKCKARRLGLELITFPIHSRKELPRVLKKIPGKIDVLWTVVDNTVYTGESLKHILLFGLRNRLPVIGYSRSFIRAGALFGLVCDYGDLGEQAGELAIKILKGEKPEEIPIEPPRKNLLIINQIVADRIGFDIPEEVTKKAYEIFKLKEEER